MGEPKMEAQKTYRERCGIVASSDPAYLAIHGLSARALLNIAATLDMTPGRDGLGPYLVLRDSEPRVVLFSED